MNSHSVRAIPVVPHWTATHPANRVVRIEKLVGFCDADSVRTPPLLQRLVARVTADNGRVVSQTVRSRKKAEPADSITNRAVQLNSPIIIAFASALSPSSHGTKGFGCTRAIGSCRLIIARIYLVAGIPATVSAAAMHTMASRRYSIGSYKPSGTPATTEGDQCNCSGWIISSIGSDARIRPNDTFLTHWSVNRF